ncbi:hypothetical protein [Phenylobacterium sp.]|uniref:hypothetical protein n=1 Tax=Phenylobacterium sp. TaxID=1871053 RepID=UPI0025D21E67|nr:hypothetical protein [Phenylobacterium sp.]MCA6339008.1 hypothetical protein [Phenylobacterium sp.]MCA6346710.1 hypothetical protein [Phenylobacterium sp.]MCA6355393.1 hypothetical protein [Phenylobacterium sp.]
MRIAVFEDHRLAAVMEGDATSLAATFAADGSGPVLRDLAASPFAATPFAALAGVSLTDFDDAVRAGGGEPQAPDLRPAFMDLALRHAGI